MKKYNEIITELRKSHNYRQKDIAEMLNISQRAYAHYEKGESEPNIEALIKLAEIYKTPIDIIVGRYEYPDEKN